MEQIGPQFSYKENTKKIIKNENFKVTTNALKKNDSKNVIKEKDFKKCISKNSSLYLPQSTTIASKLP